MTLKEIIDTEKNKTAFVCGLGPSLSESIEYIRKNRNEIVLICCNDVDLNTDLVPDYWVFANSIQTFPSMINRFEKYKDVTIVHSDSVDATPKEWIEPHTTNLKYIGYDQRHFNNSTCNDCPNGCRNFIDGRLTIQEELQKYTNFNSRYSPGDTVAIHMTALSILLGCNKVYITGVDLDYKKGYYNTNRPPMLVTEFDPCLGNILKDFDIINQSAINKKVEIINLSNDSHLTKVLKTESL